MEIEEENLDRELSFKKRKQKITIIQDIPAKEEISSKMFLKYSIIYSLLFLTAGLSLLFFLNLQVEPSEEMTLINEFSLLFLFFVTGISFTSIILGTILLESKEKRKKWWSQFKDKINNYISH